MRDLRFDWDPAKDIANRDSHGVSFAEAQTVFSDEVIRIISARKATRKERRQYNQGWTK
jgi:uncharacterized DUF497 family protein